MPFLCKWDYARCIKGAVKGTGGWIRKGVLRRQTRATGLSESAQKTVTLLKSTFKLDSVSLRFSSLDSLVQGYLEGKYYCRLSLSLSQFVLSQAFSTSPPWAVWLKARAQTNVKSSSCLPPVSAGLLYIVLYAFLLISRVVADETINHINFLLMWISIIDSVSFHLLCLQNSTSLSLLHKELFFPLT